MAKISVIVVAAGKGTRFGGSEKKCLAKVDGQPMFLRSLQLFVNREDVGETVLVVSPADEGAIKDKYGANLGFLGVKMAVGGAQRSDSVANGLAQVSPEAEYIAIHDAARPCTSTEMIDRVFGEAVKTGAAILAAPLRGTIKRGSGAGVVDETVSREGLWEAQTPQVFRREIILVAYAKRGEFPGEPTDDAQLVEAVGHPVHLVASDLSNLKITAQGDIALANAILKSRPAPKPKGFLRPFEEAQW